MSEHRVRWVRLGWREPFMWQRAVAAVLGSSLLVGVCLAAHAGLFALLALALGAWPKPVRLTVTEQGVTLRSLFVSQRLPADEIVALRRVSGRFGPAWQRGSALALERLGEPAVMLHASDAVLGPLERELRARLQLLLD